MNQLAPTTGRPLPIVGRLIGVVADLGAVACLAAAAARALASPFGGGPRLLPAIARQADGLFAAGFLLVGLVHVPFGSSLAMQAYYGATFTEAAGPVVGLGLLRNVAPLLTGFTLAGLIAVRAAWELRDPSRPGLDGDDRGGSGRPTDPGRLVLVRVLAGMLAGPVLMAWGTALGTFVGCLAARAMLGVAPALFVEGILARLEPLDAIGLIVKGAGFPAIAALVACREAFRSAAEAEGGAAVEDRSPLATAVRATAKSALAILLLNLAWFNVAYMSGPPFGPLVR